jgi:hypothetical protein
MKTTIFLKMDETKKVWKILALQRYQWKHRKLSWDYPFKGCWILMRFYQKPTEVKFIIVLKGQYHEIFDRRFFR